jgi:hypothetical protein
VPVPRELVEIHSPEEVVTQKDAQQQILAQHHCLVSLVNVDRGVMTFLVVSALFVILPVRNVSAKKVLLGMETFCACHLFFLHYVHLGVETTVIVSSEYQTNVHAVPECLEILIKGALAMLRNALFVEIRLNVFRRVVDPPASVKRGLQAVHSSVVMI